MSEYKLVPVVPGEQWARRLHDVCRNGKDVFYDQDLLLAMIYNVLAAAPDAPAVQAEPVAWAVQDEGCGYTRFYVMQSDAEYYRERKGWSIRPLYDHPPADMADKLAVALREIANQFSHGVPSAFSALMLCRDIANKTLAEYEQKGVGK